MCGRPLFSLAGVEDIDNLLKVFHQDGLGCWKGGMIVCLSHSDYLYLGVPSRAPEIPSRDLMFLS